MQTSVVVPDRIQDYLTQQVLALLEEGDPRAACAVLLETLGPQLRGYLRRALLDEADGDDAYQDLGKILCEQLPRFRGDSSARTWSYGIVHHLISRHRRRYSQRHGTRLKSNAQDRLVQPSASSALSHERQRIAAEEIMEELEPEERELLILRVDRQLSFHEIGDVFQISEAAAKQRFHRLVQKLRALAAHLGWR